MSASTPESGRSSGSPRRLIIYGVTGHLGQEILERLDESDWPIGELVGIASANSAGTDFEFRGAELDVVGEAPPLKGWDLVMICTRGIESLEIVRECLKAEVPCIDLTGSLSTQLEVPMPLVGRVAGDAGDALAAAPLIGLPSSTTLSWVAVLEALAGLSGLTRVTGTVLCSASSNGHHGLVALSKESIALFNQSDPPGPGPAGQAVAFDVVPGGGINCERVRREVMRALGGDIAVDVTSLQVPTFVGEGTSLAIQFAEPVSRDDVEARLIEAAGISVVQDGAGSRGLAAVGKGEPEPIGPTLRDVTGVDEVLVGRIESDTSLSEGLGFRVWLASDPLRLAASHALRVAGRRLGLA